MPDRPPLVAAPADPCQDPPGATMNWPIGGAIIECASVSPDNVHGDHGAPIALTIKISITKGLKLNQAPTLSLLYIVNGSLDYSALFSSSQIGENSQVTLKQDAEGDWVGSVTILTLPLPPNSQFELEVLAYPASAVKIISGPVRAKADADDASDDKSLKALHVLATTALVTALGALAFALLRSKD